MRHTSKNSVRRNTIFESAEESHSKFSDLVLVSPQEAARHIFADFLAHGELVEEVFWIPHHNFKVVVTNFHLRDLDNLVSIASEKIQRLSDSSFSGSDIDDAKMALKDIVVKFVEGYKEVIGKTLNIDRKQLPLKKAVGANDSSVVNCPILMKGFAMWGIKDFTTNGISEDFKEKFIESVEESVISLFNRRIFADIFTEKEGEFEEANLDETRDGFVEFVDYIASELYNRLEISFNTRPFTEEIFLPSATWVTYQDINGFISIASLHKIKWLVGKESGSIDNEIRRLVNGWLDKIKRPRGAKFSQIDMDKLKDIIERIIENGELHNEIIRLLVGYVNSAYENLSFWLDKFLEEIVRLISTEKSAQELVNLFLKEKAAEVEEKIKEKDKNTKKEGKRKYFFYL
jgi:hypothetical protein